MIGLIVVFLIRVGEKDALMVEDDACNNVPWAKMSNKLVDTVTDIFPFFALHGATHIEIE